MAKAVKVIPPTISRFTAQPLNAIKKRKVAGYGRVSTDSDEQATSYVAQVDYYTNYIQSRSDWEFVGMYTDEGITATNTKHRSGFKQMVQDALDGKIDLIITKSVSRFARNTVDSLTTVRKLKEKGVEIYFEKENIWTLDAKGELLITIMSSLAQEESRSISENTTWGKRKSFADGKVTMAFKTFLGYDKGPNGEFVVNEEQARIVRMIYRLYMQGLSSYKIACTLTEKGIPTVTGKKIWRADAIQRILTNEKYKGDALLQKTFTVDFLTKKSKKNEGEIPQYYVDGHHEAIIDPQTFDLVQAEVARRNTIATYEKYSGAGMFSSKIKCGDCGGWFGSKIWHSNDKYRKIIFRCNHKFKGEKKCSTPHITEDEIKECFVRAMAEILTEKDELIENARLMLDLVCSTEELEKQAEELGTELQVQMEMVQNIIEQNARVATDQEEYQKKYDSMVKKYNATKDEYERVLDAISKKTDKRRVIENFIGVMEQRDCTVTEFDEGLWCSLVDYMTVYSKEEVGFTLSNGIEIRVAK